MCKRPGNSEQLFSTVNHLLKPQSPPTYWHTEEQCNDFMDFFTSKIAHIRSAFSGPPTQTVPPTYAISQPLNCFPVVSPEEVHYIIRQMKTSTCALDPLPPLSDFSKNTPLTWKSYQTTDPSPISPSYPKYLRKQLPPTFKITSN